MGSALPGCAPRVCPAPPGWDPGTIPVAPRMQPRDVPRTPGMLPRDAPCASGMCLGMHPGMCPSACGVSPVSPRICPGMRPVPLGCAPGCAPCPAVHSEVHSVPPPPHALCAPGCAVHPQMCVRTCQGCTMHPWMHPRMCHMPQHARWDAPRGESCPPGCARGCAVTFRLSPKSRAPLAAPLCPPSCRRQSLPPLEGGCMGCCITGIGGCGHLHPPCQLQGWLGLQAGRGQSPQLCCRKGNGSSCCQDTLGHQPAPGAGPVLCQAPVSCCQRIVGSPGSLPRRAAGICSHLGTFLQESHLLCIPRDRRSSAPTVGPG